MICGRAIQACSRLRETWMSFEENANANSSLHSHTMSSNIMRMIAAGRHLFI